MKDTDAKAATSSMKHSSNVHCETNVHCALFTEGMTKCPEQEMSYNQYLTSEEKYISKTDSEQSFELVNGE